MTVIMGLIATYGAPAVIVGAVVYIVLRGEFRFTYPRKREAERASERLRP